MTNPRPLALLSALLFCCALVCAQSKEPEKPKTDEKPKAEKKEPEVKVGDKAPVLKVDSILHPKLKNLAELRGRLVLYEYFQHW